MRKVETAAATVRATLAKLVSQRQPTSSLTSPPTVPATKDDASGPPPSTQGTQGQSRAS
jgi:hypothetical protein